MANVDVLIVGAGPTGLMMACELLRYGIACRIIDKEAAPTTKSKAIAIQARTLEVLQQAQLVEGFLAEGLKLHAGSIFSAKKRVAQLHLEHIDSPFPFVLSLEQSHTESIFIKHLKSLGLRIERQVELVKFKQRDQHVEVTLKHLHSGAEEKIITHWLIGCDGAHSVVRKGIGATFKGKLFSDVFSLADVDIHWDMPHDQVAAFIESEGVMAVLPIPGEHHYRLIFQMKRCRDLLKPGFQSQEGIIAPSFAPPPTINEVNEMLHKYVGKEFEIKNPTWLANFHINSRLASTFRNKRVFLAGDASHIHSPVGGQGMNTGLQDAFNLAWKLALVHRNKASDNLLDSYQTERYEVGARLLKMTELASSAVTMHNPALIAVRNFIMTHLTQFDFVQDKITAELSENSIHYPHSPLNAEVGHFLGSLKVGDRAPNGSIVSQDITTNLFQIWKGSTKGILLLFTGDALDSIQQLEELAHLLENKYPVQSYIITADPYGSPSHRIAIDPDLKVHETYGVNEPAIYYIRPDLYIGYRQTGTAIQQIDDYLFRIYIEKPSKR